MLITSDQVGYIATTCPKCKLFTINIICLLTQSSNDISKEPGSGEEGNEEAIQVEVALCHVLCLTDDDQSNVILIIVRGIAKWSKFTVRVTAFQTFIYLHEIFFMYTHTQTHTHTHTHTHTQLVYLPGQSLAWSQQVF